MKSICLTVYNFKDMILNFNLFYRIRFNFRKTPMDILDQVRERIRNASEVHNESSFGLFLRLLGMYNILLFTSQTYALRKLCYLTI